MPLPAYDAIVLAGGSARRLGGVDKPALVLGGSSLLHRAVDAVHDAEQVVVVGPVRPLEHEVIWTREDPPGSGPVAALAAGLERVSQDVVVVLAADLPWIAAAVPVLRAQVGECGAALLVDASGRVNHLAGAWRTDSLRDALTTLGELDGAAMRAVVAMTECVLVPDTGGWSQDCDTRDELAAARAALSTTGGRRA